MNELIKIENTPSGPSLRDTTIGGSCVPTVSARELHKFLGSKQDFSTWIKNRIEKYEFVENQDYIRFHKKMEANNATLRRYTILKYFSDRQVEGLDIYKAIKALDEGRDIRKEHLFPSLTPIPYYLPSFALPSSPYHNVHLAIAPLLEFQEDLQRGLFFEPVEEIAFGSIRSSGHQGAPPSLEAREPLELSSPEILLYGELPPEEELLALLPACRELRVPAEKPLWSVSLDEDKLFSYPPLKRRYI